MNRREFYSLNTVQGYKFLNDDCCSQLYDYFCFGGKIYNYDILISLSDFEKIFNIIHDNYNSIFNEIQFKIMFMQYIQLIMSDCVNGVNADVAWFINCVDYLSLDILSNSFLKKGKPLCKKIKSELILEFGIDSRFRKIFGKYFVKKI